MRTQLLPRAFLDTPTVPEAEELSQVEIRTDHDRRRAAKRIASLGPAAVLITGGHLPGDEIQDVLFWRGTFHEFRTVRVAGDHTHGTGCTFAAALTAHLALGHALTDAVPLAQDYVAEAIRHAPGLGRGRGPMNHLWKHAAVERPAAL